MLSKQQKANTSQLAPTALLAAPVVGVAGWLAAGDRITAWALANGYFTTTGPLFAIPATQPRGAGPTTLFSLATAAVLIGAIAAVMIAVRIWVAPVQRDDDDRRPLPPVTAPLLAAIALIFGILTVALIPFIPDLLAAAAGITAAAALHLPLSDKLHDLRDKATYLNEIEWTMYPYLGYDELPRRRIVAITEWDQATDDQPERPQTILLAYRGRREELKPELGKRLDGAVEAHYTLTFATRDQLITASLASANAEPQQVRDLREQLTTSALFESTATLRDPKYSEAGALVEFTVRHQIGAKLSGGERMRTIERKISDLLPGRWRTKHTDNLAGTVTFELRAELPTLVYPPVTTAVTTVAQACQRYSGAVIPLAIDEDGNTIEWWLEGHPHCLLMGPTGTGKTRVIDNILLQAAPLGARIFIIDFKGGEFTSFRDYPNVVSVITEPHEAVALVTILYREMQNRYNLYKRNRSALANKEPFLIIFDEYTEFQDGLKRFYATTKGKKAPRDCPTLTQFSSLLRLGRTCRFHCVAALQRADQKFLEGEAKDNFTMRLSLGRLSTQAALMIHNDAYAGRSVPLGVRGRGTTLNRDGRPAEVQSFYAPDPDSPINDTERQVLADLRPPQALYERGIIMPPPRNPVIEPDDFCVYQNLPLLRAAEHPELDPSSDSYAPPAWMSFEDRGVDSIFGALPTGLNTLTPTSSAALVEVYEDAMDDARQVTIDELQYGDYVRDPNTGGWAILDEDPLDGDDPGMTALILRDRYDGTRSEIHLPEDAIVDVRDISEQHLITAS